jgi:hypothetical protein
MVAGDGHLARRLERTPEAQAQLADELLAMHLHLQMLAALLQEAYPEQEKLHRAANDAAEAVAILMDSHGDVIEIEWDDEEEEEVEIQDADESGSPPE